MEQIPKKNVPHGDSIDRLSNLSDEILHYILSLSGLQIFDVVELGVLSKRWNRLWLTTPYLDIDITRFRSSREQSGHTFFEKIRSFIDWVLTRQGESKLVRFRLRGNLFHEVQTLRWLSVLALRNVQELDIKFFPREDFRLPLSIAVNDSLRVLNLSLGNYVMQIPSFVRLNRLTSLELNRIEFLDTDSVQRLFSGCCSLERLMFENCNLQSHRFLDFSSTRLKELIIHFTVSKTDDDFENFEIKVSCPNLISFGLAAHGSMNFILENFSSLETARIDMFEALFRLGLKATQILPRILKNVHNVKDLNLDWNVVSNLTYSIDELIRCPTSFPNMKSLSLYISIDNNETDVLFYLLDHCPNLEVLTLVSGNFYGEGWDDEHLELQCEGIVSWKSHPHLKTIEFVDFEGDRNELGFLRFLFKNAKSLERLDIIWSHYSKIAIEVIDEVLMFPKASSGIVVTFTDPLR